MIPGRYIVYAGLALLPAGAFLQSGWPAGVTVAAGCLIAVGIFKMIMRAVS